MGIPGVAFALLPGDWPLARVARRRAVTTWRPPIAHLAPWLVKWAADTVSNLRPWVICGALRRWMRARRTTPPDIAGSPAGRLSPRRLVIRLGTRSTTVLPRTLPIVACAWTPASCGMAVIT